MPGFDETEEEISYRVREPEQFDQYGSKPVEDGVTILLGLNMDTDKWQVQSIQFDKEVFSMDQARIWIKDHPNVANKVVKFSPGALHQPFKLSMMITKAIGEVDSEHFYIFGEASVELIDKEGDKISAKALKYGLAQLLRRKRLSLIHTDILVGEIIKEREIDGKIYRTEVTDHSLMVLGDIWSDSKKSRETREGILDGTYDSYSISGESLSNAVICDKDECWNQIDKIDLSAVAICEEGMNQAAKFTLLKSYEDQLVVSEDSQDEKEGGTPMKKRGTKKDGTDADEERTGEDKQEEEETPASPEEEEEEEESIAESLKSLTEEVATLNARVDALEQTKDKQEDEEEEEEEEEISEQDEDEEEEEEIEAGKADSDSDQEEELPAPEDTQSSEETKNENPEGLPTKKSLVKDAGGSQFHKDTKTGFEDVGRAVKKAGGLKKFLSKKN